MQTNPDWAGCLSTVRGTKAIKTASLRRTNPDRSGCRRTGRGTSGSGFKAMKTAPLRRQTQIGQVAAAQGEAPVFQVSRQ